MTIDIIGAGIGGLTTAIALEQKGFKTRIFEQAEKFKPVGAGIILANNAMQVYEKLGLRNIIEEKGNPILSMNITKANLKAISKIDLSYFEKKHKVRNIAIHRGTLQQILIDELKSTPIHLDHKLTKMVKDKNRYSLYFENGQQIQSSIVLGADGLNSAVRKQLFPNNTIRNANQICWRGITEHNLPIKYRSELNEAWGKSERFGFVQLSESKVYWYALKSFKNDKNELSINNIEKYFSSYNPVIKNIIASTQKEQINTAEISDLKPTNIWYKENVCLLGDSAHATTPNMGQGACQAIEDAFILSECLDRYETNKAFEEFQKLRLPKAHQVVKASWFVGKIAHLSNPILVGIRNQMIRMTPSSINRKQSEQIFQLSSL
ncbi:FAD-dependent monooxygenase [Aquimarina sp. 2201CG5-10]|uniref:FAD-dependent monooxygenase n=1 Tax=Aquimarina callyspongiae TaxID=3098150 RepID=UPI002AB49636|nr:FAD-dependent monooxygenase [Aquimarina sp. 2201CG5-10]MDY8137262.1 FAD-dependent monooxygenase [Aquimarina sp. 2201CG5-10]